MGDSSAEDTSRLWKVNRTIHELVKDRVSNLFSYGLTVFLTSFFSQGFLVSDEEIHMDLATFKQLYANSGGSVECVK